MGIALLLLWRLDRRYPQIRQWGWSWILLAAGLALGVALADLTQAGWRHDLQALVASSCLMGSLWLQVAGARSYRGLALRRTIWMPLFITMMLSMVGLASVDQRYAVIAATVFLVTGAWACAWWMGRAGDTGERFVALCFVASGLVHASSPLLDPLGRSPITHALGLIVQTVLSLGLILLSVARAHREARLQAERFSKLAEHSLQGLTVIQDRKAVYANPAARTIFGFGAETPAGSTDVVTALVPADLQDDSLARHDEVLANPDARIEWESTRLTKGGRLIHIRGLSSHLDWDGAPAELLVMIDETARQRAVDALRRQALHDELTDLPNRNFAVERLRQLCYLSAPPFALISADLDRFQLVNESLGHEVGDALLRAIARRLCRQLPPSATLTRLGEDQFLVLLEGSGEREEVRAVVEQMMGMLAMPFAVEGAELFVHMSVGVALFPQDARVGADLLRAADSAMHRAKRRAGAAYLFFDKAMNGASKARLDTEQALGRAIADGEFLLEYQPKFRAGSRCLVGFEALVRWERPERGRIPPGEFIPAAERTGQIKALGELILSLARSQLLEWQQRFGRVLPVAVNVSPLQFEDAGFAGRLLAGLDAAGLPHGAMEIEITETAAIGHLGRVLPQLQRLRSEGVLCALDDFGTGQSSLTMLRQLPISTMKLDRSMIDPLPEPGASAVVQATCALGQSLKLEIVAEGVETEVQAQAAEALGCTQLQGYHLGRPLPAAQAGELLARFLLQ